jgi:molybdate transport system ATP-binding protein
MSPDPDSKPLIELKHCSLIFDDRPVLDDVSFTLRRGERWALVGPNGSGKSMLLKMLRGDVWPTPTGREERIWRVEGHAQRQPAGIKELIAYLGPERQDKYVRYDWDLSVTEVVTTGLFDEDIPLTTPTRAQHQKIERLLRRFSLWTLRNRSILSLSYGQRRLALVARVFASPARILLLDEVFNGLDAKTKARLTDALEQPRGGHDWIITSHRPAELPSNLTHVARIANGRLVNVTRVSSRHPHPQLSGERATRRREVDPRSLATSLTSRGHPSETKSRTQRLRLSSPRPRAGERRVGAKKGWLVRITDADIYRDYRPVIRQLNWTLNRGEHWAVLGANGSGKSSILNMIYGDLHPALGGRIERQGTPKGTRIEEWKRRVGFVSPELQANYFAAKSLEEIVISGRYASIGLNEPATAGDRRAATRWLEFFGLNALRHRGPRHVSYGQMRLALIARAMMTNPELLLLDEPCTGLDHDIREQVLAIIEQLARSGTQIVMAVHDRDDIVPAIEHVLQIGKGGKTREAQISQSLVG